MTSGNSVRATGCGARHYLGNASLYPDQVRKSKLAMKITGVEIKQTQEKPSEPRLLRTLKIRDHDRGVTMRSTSRSWGNLALYLPAGNAGFRQWQFKKREPTGNVHSGD